MTPPQDLRSWPQLAISVLLLCSTAHIIAAAEQTPAFTNDLGWTWHYGPAPMMGEGGPSANPELVLQWYRSNTNELFLAWTCQPHSFTSILRWRPIAIGPSGERFEFRFRSSGGTSNLNLATYLLDLKTLPLDQLKYIGIEKLTEEGFRNARVPAAYRQLKAAGIEVLPVPRMNEPYNFEVTPSDGKKVRSGDFRGKVVLLDFWATTCPACMAKMPHLKEIYRKQHKDGFEIIGLNLDLTLAAAKRAIAKQALPWPNVPGPEDKNHRDLWAEATGTFAIPRLLLIDRNGILRADILPDRLEAEIEKLMSTP